MIDFFLRYIETEKRLSPHTVKAYKSDLEQLALYLSVEYEMTEVQKADFQILRSWVMSLVESKLDHRSVNRKIATLRSFYGFLVRRKHILIDPTPRIVALKTDKKLPVFVEETQTQFLFDEVTFADDFNGHRDRLVLEMLYGTGIRLSELIGLKTVGVHFFDRTIKVLGKRNKQRIIPVGEVLMLCIQKYLQTYRLHFNTEGTPNYLLLTDDGEQTYPVLIQRIVKNYLSLVTTLSQKSPHVLRHTYATHLLNRGADLNAIKDLLGHSSLAATQVYTHNNIERLKKAYQEAHPKA